MAISSSGGGAAVLILATSALLSGCCCHLPHRCDGTVPDALAPQARALATAAALDADLHRLMSEDRPWLPPIPENHPGEMVPFMACFDPSSPPTPAVMEKVDALIRSTLAKYNLGTRWSNTSFGGTGSAGTPITLRWSLVPDTVNAPDLDGIQAPSTLFASMDAKFGGNRAQWIALFQQCFNRWSALTGVNYERVQAGGQDWDDGAAWGTGGSAGLRGDVRIAMRALDGSSGVLAFNNFPNGGDMVMDSAENWANSANGHRFFRNTVMHEHGHGLGLGHVCPTNNSKLMEPNLSTLFDGPQQDDLRGIHNHYGDVNEPNGGVSVATPVGPLPPSFATIVGSTPSPTVANASTVAISVTGDQDWYRVTTTHNAITLNITATPLGTEYAHATASGSSCPASSATTNALTKANLAIDVRDALGTSIQAAADNTAAGSAETLNGVLLSGGAAYVRVYQVGSMGGAQEYRLSIATGAALAFTASDALFTDRIALAWSAVPNVTQYQVLRSDTSSRVSASPIATVVGTTYGDADFTPGQTYWYWVRVQQTGAALAVDMAGPETGSAAVPPACPADLGVQGGTFGQDGALDNNDFVVFINFFFTQDSRADFGVQGGTPGQDGAFDNNDFVVFINAFFAGCP